MFINFARFHLLDERVKCSLPVKQVGLDLNGLGVRDDASKSIRVGLGYS